MGTNYYVYEKRAFSASIMPDGKHFGKRSAGWDFALHVYPDEGIERLEDWLYLLSDKNVEIRDEYGRKIKLKQLLRIVLKGEGCALAGSSDLSEYEVLNPFTERVHPKPDSDLGEDCYAIFPSYFCRDHDFG